MLRRGIYEVFKADKRGHMTVKVLTDVLDKAIAENAPVDHIFHPIEVNNSAGLYRANMLFYT